MNLVRRAMAIGLRALAAEVEAGTLDPLELLGHVSAPLPAAAPQRPRRRAKAGARKRRPAAQAELPAEGDEGEQVTEASRLVGELVAAHGSPQAVALRFGLDVRALGRYASGYRCSPAALSRLRQARARGAMGEKARACLVERDSVGEPQDQG